MQISGQIFDEERSLYGISDSQIDNCKFDGPADGESAFKESRNICVSNSYFNLRYPFWHSENTDINNCEMTVNCRAALWYDKNVKIDNCKLFGIKALRECSDFTLKNSQVSSTEFIWKCKNVNIENVEILESEYQLSEQLSLVCHLH